MDNANARERVADWVSVEQLNTDPYPTYDRLRREGPVMWVPLMGRHLTASYDSAVGVEADPELFTAWEPDGQSTMLRTMHGRPMNRKDDPEHMADRRVEVRPLKPAAIKRTWLQVFDDSADRFLDELIDAGPDVNFMTHFAGPYAADILRRVIGFTNVDHSDVKRWSKNLCNGIGNVTDDPDIWARTERTNDEIDAAIAEHIPYYRDHADDTLLSAFLHSDLPMENLHANIKLTIAGGMNEPQNIVAAAIYGLLTHPQQLALVNAGEYDYAAVFEETVRWMTPIGMFPRTVTRDTEYFGARLYAGDKIAALTGAANRDETVFENPAQFDLTRPHHPHFAFGSGTHICAGMWVSRAAVGKVALPKIFRRLQGLAMSQEREPVVQGWVFHGLTDLPLTWTGVNGS
ncbi:MAG: cytochrome P450 [Tomitella sp.]|nr:cytochrome P450 [Tomitella sp.]